MSGEVQVITKKKTIFERENDEFENKVLDSESQEQTVSATDLDKHLTKKSSLVLDDVVKIGANNTAS